MARARTKASAAVTAAGIWIIVCVGGCASYGNYPPIGTSADDAAVNDPNLAPIPTLIRVGLRHVIERFPVEGEYLVNLPRGMTSRRAREFMGRLGEPAAHLPTTAADPRPVYHVNRVWLRPGGRSEVEILRPVFGVGTPGDAVQYQPVSVYLRRTPLEQWKVDSVRVWPIGIAETPPLYGWDDAAG